MRLPHRNPPGDPWMDDEVAEMYRHVPAAPAWPDAYVDEDKVDRIPFGFQRPARSRPATGRQRSRQAAARAHHARKAAS